MSPVTVGYGEDRIEFGINRRKVINGRAVVRLNKDGPNDPRVKVLRFDNGKSSTPLAIVMHAVCHPCFFTWGDKGSPPYITGGYEPNTSRLTPEAESIILAELSLLADRVVGDVFASFSQHPKDIQQREQADKARAEKLQKRTLSQPRLWRGLRRSTAHHPAGN